MQELICTFNAPLIAGQFGCRYGLTVTRRGGPDVACQDESAQNRCQNVVTRLKGTALPAFGVEDDLSSMPHSVLVKIQYAGLLGIQRLLNNASNLDVSIDDIDGMLSNAERHYAGLQQIPYAELVQDITSFKIKRQRHR